VRLVKREFFLSGEPTYEYSLTGDTVSFGHTHPMPLISTSGDSNFNGTSHF
jgi:hypothetical protein